MQSASTKLESGSEKQVNKWRLSRTLTREITYRKMEVEDIRYAFAAYKNGNLASMGFEGTSLSPEEFKSKFEAMIVTHCDGCWIFFAPNKKGKIPVGIIMAGWVPLQAYLIVLGIVWFPWASNRNVVESVVNFFNESRNEFRFMGYALPEHKKVYELCAKHGIMRRVGTSFNAIPGKPCAVFETLEPKRHVRFIRE